MRELRNVLERAAILAGGGLITSEHLALPAPAPPQSSGASDPATAPRRIGLPAGTERRQTLPDVEREMVENALVGARYNKSEAARALGLTRAQFYVRLKRHGLAI